MQLCAHWQINLCSIKWHGLHFLSTDFSSIAFDCLYILLLTNCINVGGSPHITSLCSSYVHKGCCEKVKSSPFSFSRIREIIIIIINIIIIILCVYIYVYYIGLV